MILRGHEGRVNSAAYSLDGTRIVTASIDGSARIWEAATGRQIAEIQGHRDPLWIFWGASFSPDGTQIVTTSEDNTARLWDVSRTAIVASNSAISLTASLAAGIGFRTGYEASDLLMQEAPDDLFSESRRQLFDVQKYSTEQIAARGQQLEQAISALGTPLHPNCYLSPTQFAKKFQATQPEAAASEKDALVAVTNGESANATRNAARTTVTEADLAGQAFVETVSGVHIFRLADGRYHVISHFAVPSLEAARIAAEELTDSRS